MNTVLPPDLPPDALKESLQSGVVEYCPHCSALTWADRRWCPACRQIKRLDAEGPLLTHCGFCGVCFEVGEAHHCPGVASADWRASGEVEKERAAQTMGGSR